MATDARDLSTAPERINPAPENVDLGAYKYGWHDPVTAVFTPKKGLSHEVVEEISRMKGEPEWMRKFRHKSLDYFLRRPMPTWGGDLSKIDFDDIYYFLRATEKQATSWEELPPDIKNTYDKLGIPEAEKQRLIAGVAAQYECLAGDTRVWTANRGFVPIKEIQPGDRVFSYDEAAGRFITAPVRAAAQTDVRQTFEVQVGGRAIRATDNHPVLVLRDERKPGRQRARYAKRWVTVGELRVGDLVAVPCDLPAFGQECSLPEVEGLATPTVTSTDLLWLLGAYVGDGNLHISGRTWRVQFAVPATDPEVRAEIARIVRELFGLRAIEADKYRVVVSSKALVRWIEQLGFGGLGHTKRIPDWVYGLPLAQRLAFLGGWIDADGHLRPEAPGSAVLTSVNLPLLQQAAELATLCGLQASGPWELQSPQVKDPSRTVIGFRLGIAGDFERLDCRNPRRATRFGPGRSPARGTTVRARVTEQLGFARVTALEPATVEPVYDIEVDGPHNFVAEGLVVHNSEVVYHKVREDLEAQGVIFLDTDTALREHEDLFREHWATVIPPNDNKFAALNSAVWSGGSFIWVPEGVHVEIPLQAYFRINAQNMGQFERTLIIAEPGSSVHYVEGCTAPIYSTDSLHSAVVEIIVKPHAKVRYTTIQNWSHNVYNLVTKRAIAHEGATMEWIDGNIGCLTGDTQIFLSPHGPRAIKEVQAGDQIYAVDLQAMRVARRRVNAVVCTGIKPVFKLTTENHREIRATANHPFLTLRRPKHGKTWRVEWRSLDSLQPGDLIAMAAGLPDEGRPHRIAFQPDLKSVKHVPALPAETDEELLWLAGFYLGDGFIERGPSGRPSRVIFAVPNGDPAKPEVERILAEKFRLPWSVKGVNLRVASRVFAEFLLHLGLGGTAHEKRIPRWVYSLPASQRLAFIEGYLAADGHVRHQSTGKDGTQLGQIAFASRNRELLEDLRTLMIAAGLNPLKISTYVKDRVLLDKYQRVYVTHYLTLNLRDIPAIRKRLAPAAGVEFVRIRSIEPDGEEPVYDIEVEGAHNFVANGLVVHNSKLTMKYPAVILAGPHAHGEVLSVAFASKGQHQDAGAKLTFAAPNTTGQIISKSISRDGGRTSYRGLIKVEEGAQGVKATVRCDALLLDEESRSDTYPYTDVKEEDVTLGHEATVSKIGDDQLFYLQSRGLTEAEATAMIVRGFIEPISKELPMEYALELNRLVTLQMEGAIG